MSITNYPAAEEGTIEFAMLQYHSERTVNARMGEESAEGQYGGRLIRHGTRTFERDDLSYAL